MKFFSIIVIAFAALGRVGPACAQEAVAIREPVFVATGMTPAVATMQANDVMRAAQLRRDWVAAGNKEAAAANPAILSGQILTPTIDVQTAPAAPQLSVKFKTGAPGLNYLYGFISNAQGQYLYIQYSVPYQSKGPTSGTLTIQNSQLNLYAAPGTWTLSYMYIVDQAGNSSSYGQSQLTSLFPSLTITVTNSGTADSMRPTLSAGAILTPTVKLSAAHPTFNTTLTVADDISGVRNTVVFLKPPGGSYGCGYNVSPPSPLLSGTVNDNGSLSCFGPTPPTGTWTIVGWNICDVAGNCLYDTTPADVKALFGATTFKVVK